MKPSLRARLVARTWWTLMSLTRWWCTHDASWTGDRKGRMRCDICGGKTGETWLEAHLP